MSRAETGALHPVYRRLLAVVNQGEPPSGGRQQGSSLSSLDLLLAMVELTMRLSNRREPPAAFSRRPGS